MDEWEILDLKIKKLGTDFLGGPVTAVETPAKPAEADIRRNRYQQEREAWEKALASRAQEQSRLQERYVKDDEGVSLLTRKIQYLEKKLSSGRVDIPESEIEAVRKEWKEKAAAIGRQNSLLQDKLEKTSEDIIQAFEDKIESLQKESEAKLHGNEAEKNALMDALSKLKEEFLEFSCAPALDVREMDLNVLAARAVARRRESLQARKIVLEKNFSAQPPKIRGDEGRIVRALEEIISNAVDAMPEGKLLAITVALQEKVRLVTVTIRDEGHGIAQDLAEKILRPYFTMRKGRRGMGLARVKRCMDVHNGFLRVSSEENQGTAVTLEFPLPN